jgi:predicted RNA binding protein YcfA (HicA-like mRNA interferase family)/predicted RNase H-like HicB family nuclease
MLTNSRDIIRRLEREGWKLVRTVGSHHVFKSPIADKTVVVTHPNKDLGKGWFMPSIRAQDGNAIETAMTHYIAVIEDAGPEYAVGVWFPDLPGCTSGGDDLDEALRNAPEAMALYLEDFESDGKPFPRPRTLTELKADPEVAEDLQNYMFALIELPARAHAAE